MNRIWAEPRGVDLRAELQSAQLVEDVELEEKEPPEAAMNKQPRFGFRMDRQTFQALRSLAPELPGAHWPGLTPDGQRAWDNGELGAVYNTGYYVEEDLNSDGEPDAALLLEVPQPSGVEQPYLLVATRRIPGVAWTRAGLVRLPPPTLHEWSIMDAIEQLSNVQDPQLAAFLRHAKQAAGSVVERSGEVESATPAPTRPVTEWMVRLADQDPGVRLEAAEALGRFGPEAKPAIEALVQCFYDPEELVRNAAGTSLEQIGPTSVPALQTLVAREGSTLGRHDPGARSQRLAVNLLGRLLPVTDEAVDLAAGVCANRAIHDVVRHDACLSLAALCVREARVRHKTIETLLRVFQEADADPYLRTELIHAFGRLGSEPSIVTILTQAARSDHDPAVKVLAQQALEQMETGDFTVSERR